MSSRALVVAATLLGLYAAQKTIEFRKAVQAIEYVYLLRIYFVFTPTFSWALVAHPYPSTSNHPGLRTVLNTLGPIENFFPRLWGITPGSYHMFTRKHLDFEIYGWDLISYVSCHASSSRDCWPHTSTHHACTQVTAFWGSRTNFFVADADALNVSCPLSLYESTCIYHDVLQEITTHRARFPKPLEQYKLLQFFGGNIVASEGDEWKRYRKISAPAFSEVSRHSLR
jgi:hypothetical protein